MECEDATRTEAQRDDGVGKASYTVDMWRNSLPRKVFVYYQLIELMWCVLLAAEAFSECGCPIRQWSEIHIVVDYSTAVVVMVAVMLYSALQSAGPW
jgi:hypothetical protein